MDPVTQGVVGMAGSQLVSTKREKKLAAALGFFTGIAADLDVLISSKTDPLLELEYHRHFTHSLAFIPIGALICALVFYLLIPPLKRALGFSRVYLFCFAAYATHAVLDACTTYGTQLFWPFSDARVAWNVISVIDPLFTLPLIVILMFAIFKRSTSIGVFAAVYAVSYLLLGAVQNQRAESLALQLAESRGHQPINLSVKPSMANIITWKSVYEYDGNYYVDAVRVLKSHRIIEGTSVDKLNLSRDFPWLDENSQQAKDVERFRWFSNQHLALDPYNEQRIIDVRYSLLPNQVTGMWGITLDPNANNSAHVVWSTWTRGEDNNRVKENLPKLWEMLQP